MRRCENIEKKPPLTACLQRLSFSPTILLRQKSCSEMRRKRRTKSEIFPSEIALPDLLNRRSTYKDDNDIGSKTLYENSCDEAKLANKSTKSNFRLPTGFSEQLIRNFRIKSPLFKQNIIKEPEPITLQKDMEFLMPQNPVPQQQKNSSQILRQHTHHRHPSQHLNPHHNHNHHQQQQQQQQQHSHHHPHQQPQPHQEQQQAYNERLSGRLTSIGQNMNVFLNSLDNSYDKAIAQRLLQEDSMRLILPEKSNQEVRVERQHHDQQQCTPHHNKMTKKQLKLAQAQLDKLTQINIHLHALFSAVEHGHLDKARTILESTDVDVNSLNSDGLTPLDVAVLSNNRSMTKMLLQHGAIEGSQFKVPDSLGNHLHSLLHDAENHVQDLSGADELPQPPFSTRASFSSIIIGNTGPSVTGCTGTEADKQLGLWERRVKGLRRMLLGWDQARPPDVPNIVNVDVSGLNSVSLFIHEPNEGSIATKFKVQWSTRADFSNIVGERELNEWSSFQGQGTMGATCRINDLTQGRRYFFRASCGNVKGWGPFKTSIPTSVIPSSWRDMDNRENRFSGRQRILDDLFTAVRLARPGDASELSLDAANQQRRNPKKKTTIKQLFSAASKFQKNLRRGIYLSCILYYDDKILVTNEDFLPVIEIDETYPSSLHNDYHWLMKVACTWDDVKSLRTDMERNSTSAVHFRTKLLSAACQMQSALCISDLGQLYHKPLRDSHGIVVLSCVNTVKSPKSVSVLNSRWVPINKIQKKVTALHEDNSINEILITSIADQIHFHQTSSIKLSRGLYLGYLKMQSSVDQIQVVVTAKTPNVLPHSKIRENPHISAEEWEVLKRNKDQMMPTLEFRKKSTINTEVQYLFLEALTIAAHKLFNYMNKSPKEAITHRLYDIEVIELSPDVSFLVICPPVESSCAVPGQREILLQRGDLLSVPIQVFEMVHLRTYQNSIIQKYSRLSCILELDTALANHSHREAFSTSELQTAKERLAKLHELTSSLNAVWKGVRWLMDVIGFARDRGCVPAVSMKEILEFKKSSGSLNIVVDENSSNASNCQLLQLPTRDNKLMKSSPGRGSWPGPAANNLTNSGCYLVAEHSKSEQNLGMTSTSTRFLSATNSANTADSTSRKNSGDSNYSHSGQSYYSAGEGNDLFISRLPPSRSADTLVMRSKFIPTHHRKRATTCNPNINIPKSSYTGASDSLQSLSSDSESASYPIAQKFKTKTKLEPGITFLKPTLTALQSEIRVRKESLHISEPTSPVSEKPHRSSVKHSSDDETGTTAAIALPINSSNNIPTASTSSSLKSSVSSASSSQPPGIIQVYAAYETGLANGTSLKLHVTPRTSAREVVDLVVKQLNMAVLLKGKEGPIYTAEKLNNFCLVAVIGARERCLRDDFRPLQLQNPWRKGRLYVRQKHELLAAIEHSNRETHLI